MNLWVKTTFFQGGSEAGGGRSESSIDGRSAGRNSRTSTGRNSRNSTGRNSWRRQLSTFNLQLSTFSFQLSGGSLLITRKYFFFSAAAFNFQLSDYQDIKVSALNFQLSVSIFNFNFHFSTFRLQPSETRSWGRNEDLATREGFRSRVEQSHGNQYKK